MNIIKSETQKSPYQAQKIQFEHKQMAHGQFLLQTSENCIVQLELARCPQWALVELIAFKIFRNKIFACHINTTPAHHSISQAVRGCSIDHWNHLVEMKEVELREEGQALHHYLLMPEQIGFNSACVSSSWKNRNTSTEHSSRKYYNYGDYYGKQKTNSHRRLLAQMLTSVERRNRSVPDCGRA